MYLLDVMPTVTLLVFCLPPFLLSLLTLKLPYLSLVFCHTISFFLSHTHPHVHTHRITLQWMSPMSEWVNEPFFLLLFPSSFRLPRTFILSNPTPIYWNPTECKSSCYTLRPLPLIFSHCRPLLIQLPVFPSDRYKVGKTKGENGQSEKTWLVIERRNWK